MVKAKYSKEWNKQQPLESIHVIGNCCLFYLWKKRPKKVIAGYKQKSQPTEGPTDRLYFLFFLCTVKPSYFAFSDSSPYQIPNSFVVPKTLWNPFLGSIINRQDNYWIALTLAGSIWLFSTQYFVIAKQRGQQNRNSNVTS